LLFLPSAAQACLVRLLGVARAGGLEAGSIIRASRGAPHTTPGTGEGFQWEGDAGIGGGILDPEGAQPPPGCRRGVPGKSRGIVQAEWWPVQGSRQLAVHLSQIGEIEHGAGPSRCRTVRRWSAPEGGTAGPPVARAGFHRMAVGVTDTSTMFFVHQDRGISRLPLGTAGKPETADRPPPHRPSPGGIPACPHRNARAIESLQRILRRQQGPCEVGWQSL